MIYGAILAGGIGKRVEQYSIPKQFITIGGVPVIVTTLRQFYKNKRIQMVYIAVHNDWIVYAEQLIKASFSKEEVARTKIVSGGKERLDSFVNIMEDIVAVNGLRNEDILICHDSVRPFVRQQMIDDCIDATLEHKLALTVIPVSDTIHVAHEKEFVDGSLERSNLYNGQTPSGFSLPVLYDACNKSSIDEKAHITGTTQLLLKQGHKIRIVKGHTSNFKITTDNDLDIAERVMRGAQRSRKVELLDCTLRDGGIVINFDYGVERMSAIKACLEEAGVEYIECGYIDEKKGAEQGRTCFSSVQSVNRFLSENGKKKGVTYVAMIDYGAYDIGKLEPALAEGIDGIRLAFHKENWKDAIEWGSIILRKGYQLYIQPMVSMRYSDEEYRELISSCNTELKGADGFYLVDSFGQMDNLSLLHQLEIADQYVSMDMKIGFHAHNNRQMAFSNACAFAQYPARHTLMLDSSVMGMGKGAGNLCTELIMPVLIAEGNRYSTVKIYDEISSYFANVLKKTPWGYSLDYYLSSLYGCTPSYINIFTKDARVSTDALIELLKGMPEEKKAACDKSFAENYLTQYFERKMNE